MTGEGHPDLVGFVERIKAEAVHAQPAFVGTRAWRTLSERGILTRLYTINDPNELPDTTEVDAIMTDEVELLRQQ